MGDAQSNTQRTNAAPNQQAAAIRRYARRLNERNVSECCGKAEGRMTNWVREGKLPGRFVFECNLRSYPIDQGLWRAIKNMDEAWQNKAIRENVRERQRADRKAAISESFPKWKKKRFALLAELGAGANDGQAGGITAKALSLAGMLGKAIADAAENGEAVCGKRPRQWVNGAIRPIFEALAKNVEAAGSIGAQH